MKRISVSCVVVILMSVFAQSLYANKPYKMAAGITLGSIQGVSFKMFFSDNVAFQADLGGKVSVEHRGSYSDNQYSYHINETYWVMMLNPNLMYERPFANTSVASLYWFAGGGVSLGYRFEDSGQFGVNALGGAEVAFHSAPLALQFDFRPGYGLQFTDWYNRNLFDWSLNFSIRYYFN